MNVTKKVLVILLSMIMLLSALPISVFANTVDANNTSDGTIATDVFNNHKYMVYDLGYTWEEANEFCNRLGGHLVTITSKEEQQFIENLIENGTKNNYWLGGKRNERGTLCWVTSESIVYTNWATFQPDNDGGVENCIMMYRVPDVWSSRNLPGKWNDVIETGEVANNSYFGVENFGFICEWDNLNYATNEVDLFQDYLKNTLIPQYGSFDATQTGSISYSDITKKWFSPKGILSASIFDYDLDNSKELLVIYTQEYNYGHKINIDVYEAKNDKVILADNNIFSAYNPNTTYPSIDLTENEGHQKNINMSIVEADNKVFIVCESSIGSGVYEGTGPDYWILNYNGEEIQYTASFTRTAGGSSGFEYTVYTFDDGSLKDSAVFINEDYFIYPNDPEMIRPLYDDFEIALSAFFSEYDIKLDLNSSYNSILSNENKSTSIFNFLNKIINEDWDSYSFTFESTLSVGPCECIGNESQNPGNIYEIKVYTTYPNSQIGTGQFFKIILELYSNGISCDTEGYNLNISNSDVIKLDTAEEIDNFYSFQFEALNSGTSTLTFKEKITNTTVSIPVTVDKQNEYYRCSVFPSVSHSGSVYVTDFECEENYDGTHSISFTAYNRSSAYAVVEIKEEDGISAIPINPHSIGSGTELILNGFIYSFADIFDKNTPYYKDKENFSETKIKLDSVSNDAQITIYSSSKDSDYISLYTGVDIFTRIVLKTATLDINVEAQQITTKALLEAILKQVPKSSLTQVSQQLTNTMAKGATAETASAIYEIIFNMLENTCIDFGNIIIGTLQGMGYDAADSIVTTLIPQLEVVFLITDVVSITESLFYSDFYNGKTEIHLTKHGLHNYLCNESITVTQQNNFENDIVLDAYVVVDESEMPDIENMALSNCSIYNITLRKNGEEVQPSDELEIRVPVPNGANKEKCVIYRVESNGDKTLLSSKTEGDYLVFKTSHLSYYIVGEHTHTWNDGEITKQPTKTEYGEITYICTTCNDIKTEQIEKVSDTPSTDKNDLNEIESSDNLDNNDNLSVFDKLESFSKETIIIVGASIAGVILLVIIYVIVKKKRF